MQEPACTPIEDALRELDNLAPGAPLLALGQTIYWDEPMKAGIALAAHKLGRTFIGGVHDTDYFAKNPSGKKGSGRFTSLAHNDGSTRGLWSAAGEFSTLFGSETVVSRDLLSKSGLRLELLERDRPGFLDEATEAWGWRGIVSTDENPPITRDVPVSQIAKELCNTLDWAVNTSVDTLGGAERDSARRIGDQIHAQFCDGAEEPGLTVSTLYRRLLPEVYGLVAGEPVPMETTQTTELLKLNRSTVHRKRFDLLRLFVQNSTRKASCAAYDEAIKGGSGQYELARFGTGAIPFELVIPGHGRGTIRLGNFGAVIMTRKPVFLSYKKPLESLEQFVDLVEAKFGPDCAVIGKAVSLIGLLGREFVFVFHEGASSYVKHSRKLHDLLGFKVNPILRVRYETWDSLSATCSWVKLPEPFRRAFGTEELCTPSFAGRWRSVSDEQREILKRLGQLRSPVELLGYLDDQLGGAWKSVAQDYRNLQASLDVVRAEVEKIRATRQELYAQLHQAREKQQELEVAKGNHFREFIFEKDASAEALAQREEFNRQIEENLANIQALRASLRSRLQDQSTAAQSPAAVEAHRRRREIELEAELKRLRLIREAVTTSKGLASANRRPTAWWFPLVSPNGAWLRRVTETAQCYFETMSE